MPSNSPFIVAEMSANHLGSIARAHRIIDAARDAGADAIKFQTWKQGTMCIDPDYTIVWGDRPRNLQSLYQYAWTPWAWHRELFSHARDVGLVPFSAAFDRESVDFLETLDVDRHKVASFELVDLPLIRYMASKGKPMILSTGMATREEFETAVQHAYIYGSREVTLLVCTSAYPATAEDANLKRLGFEMHVKGRGEPLHVKMGLSDHTLGIGVAVAAVALGAIMIEKHLTLSRADGGPDAGFSMEPHEFKQMVTECRRAAASIGEVRYGPGPNESTTLRRSLWVARDISEGEALRLGDNVVTARPALGMPPDTPIDGCLARHDLKANTPLTLEQVRAG